MPTDTDTENALWLCDREPRPAMRALAAAYRQLAARVATLEAAHATKAELYVTPDHIADLAIGSGAYLTTGVATATVSGALTFSFVLHPVIAARIAALVEAAALAELQRLSQDAEELP